MHKTRSAKIDSLSTAEWQQYHKLLSSRELIATFADEIMCFSRTSMKPDEVLRRFSLNGDGQLDLREFILATKRLELVKSEHKARALYQSFCPSASRKLDVDIFCRIMTEWSLTLMREMFEQQSLQQQQQRQLRPNRTLANSLATPYAVEPHPQPATPRSSNRPNTDRDEAVAPRTSNSECSTEAEEVWRRISVPVSQHREKLRQLFLRLDVSCTGCVSQEEFEMALRHVGVFLTPREFERVYESLDEQLKILPAGGDGSTFSIRYTDLLNAMTGTNQRSARTLPTTSKLPSPPVVTVASARLWDMLVAALDKLRPLFQQFQRIQQHKLPPETFRDCLRKCGIVLSNADFAALRVRLLPFSDNASGSINLAPLVDALQLADHSNTQSRSISTPPYMEPVKPKTNGSSTSLSAAASAIGVSPIRTGRKTNFTPPGVAFSSAPHPAGKSNEQRNAEAERTMVRIRDESRWRSDLNFPSSTSPTLSSKSTDEEREQQLREQYQHHKQHQQDPFFASGGKPPVALEARILAKIQQARELGQLGGACSPQTLFPGDRFGRITRGQFRQGLVHLGVLARYAEVEALFWTLDPTGRGYMISRELYDHLGAFSAAQSSRSKDGDAWKHLIPTVSTDPSESDSPVGIPRLTRSVQKVLERMLLDFPQLFSICERCDIRKTGTVSPPELLSAIQELGILASVADTQTAIAALCPKIDPAASSSSSASSIAIPYRTLDRRLAQLCSDLLSPKKRKTMHLSTASVLLAPHEQLYSERLSTSKSSDYDMNTMSETDALWNCPRRRMNQSHRANKTSIHIGDATQSDSMASDNNNRQSDTIDRGERRRLLAIVGIIHDVLERRSDLKTVMDLHRSADAHGQVTKQDLIDILMTSRLNLDFETGGVSATEFVDALYPSPAPSSPLARNANTHVSVGFLDLLHRCSDLLTESTRILQLSQTGAATPSQKQHHRQTARRLNSSIALGVDHTTQDSGPDSMLPAMYSTSLLQPQHQRDRSSTTYGTGSLQEETSPIESIRRKLIRESRLKDLLRSDEGRRSAAVLVRHAFKGLAPREMVVPVENGEFEAMCRATDLKHACYRLGLDLDTREQAFMARALDANGSGFVSSPQVHQFLVHLARTVQDSMPGRDKLGEPRVRWNDAYEDNNHADTNIEQTIH